MALNEMARPLDHQASAVPANGGNAPAARPAGRLVVWSLALLGGALFGAALLLWARHGATVFFDTMAAGIASCM